MGGGKLIVYLDLVRDARLVVGKVSRAGLKPIRAVHERTFRG